jgi:hypothetical protein
LQSLPQALQARVTGGVAFIRVVPHFAQKRAPVLFSTWQPGQFTKILFQVKGGGSAKLVLRARAYRSTVISIEQAPLNRSTADELV